MRRSRRVATLLVGTATLLVLTACEEDPAAEARLYSDLEACKVENTPEECEKAFDAAKALHARETPRYRSQAECEDLFGQGQCEEVSTTGGGVAGQTAPSQTASSGSFFMPALMGFMLGRTMSGFGASAGYPVYSDRQGYVYAGRQQVGTCTPPNCPRPMGTATSSRLGTAAGTAATSGRYTISSTGLGTQAAQRAATRGGFGATASRMSSSVGT
jgi:uncharacterized protein YgiB involved in biofilm formation